MRSVAYVRRACMCMCVCVCVCVCVCGPWFYRATPNPGTGQILETIVVAIATDRASCNHMAVTESGSWSLLSDSQASQWANTIYNTITLADLSTLAA